MHNLPKRSPLFFSRRLRLAVSLSFLIPAASRGATIFSLGEPVNIGGLLGGTVEEITADGWTDSHAESNVSVSIVDGASASGVSVTAWLMNQIGPGTTVANQIATVTFDPASSEETDVLFSGLNLAAGTYYLVVTGDSSGKATWWGNNSSDTLVEGPSVSNGFEGVVNVITGNSHGTPDPSFAPGSTFFNDTSEITGFGESILVSSVPSTTPEPGTLAMLAGGAALLGLGLRRRRQAIS